ncbi:MAG: MoaD/ThiS family protein [Candidatus Baldrarchaeia archaeon]
MRSTETRKVCVKLLGYIAEMLGFRNRELNIGKGLRVRELLKGVNVDEKRIIVLINGKPANMDSILRGGEYVVIMPVVGGG